MCCPPIQATWRACADQQARFALDESAHCCGLHSRGPMSKHILEASRGVALFETSLLALAYQSVKLVSLLLRCHVEQARLLSEQLVILTHHPPETHTARALHLPKPFVFSQLRIFLGVLTCPNLLQLQRVDTLGSLGARWWRCTACRATHLRAQVN